MRERQAQRERERKRERERERERERDLTSMCLRSKVLMTKWALSSSSTPVTFM